VARLRCASARQARIHTDEEGRFSSAKALFGILAKGGQGSRNPPARNLYFAAFGLANCAKSFVTREGVDRAVKGYVAPEVGLPWAEWIKQ